MHSRLSFAVTTLLIVTVAPIDALSQSTASDRSLTLQIGSFPTTELTDSFVAQLVRSGEHPKCASVEVPGRGYWTRVFVGTFGTSDEARRYGDRLVARGLIKEFLVKRADSSQETTRPRRVTSIESLSNQLPSQQPPGPSLRPNDSSLLKGIPGSRRTKAKKPADKARAAHPRIFESALLGSFLPILKTRTVDIVPRPDLDSIPRPDPVNLALRLVSNGEGDFNAVQRRHGGLWVTGDKIEGLARLRWIVGDENAELIRLDADGRVLIEKDLLARASGLAEARVEDPVAVANYIAFNEGLLLITQMIYGGHKYRLHISGSAPTYGKNIEVSSSVNLDCNYDSRINPYRSQRRKLDHELPPEGFDSLIALNPSARWYNLSTKSWVPVGEIAFHELAEAYAKVEQGFEYLGQGAHPGAHAVALERENLLKAQRPEVGIVMTAGSNRVLRNSEEIRLFFADNPNGSSQR